MPTTYEAPLADMRFCLRELVDLPSLLTNHPEITPDVVDAVLDEAAKFAANVLSPTDPEGDRAGARWTPEAVTTSQGYRDAYAKFVEAGWHALSCDPRWGGQGFPRAISALADEMWRASTLALTGCVALTRSAIEALALRASDELQSLYLPPLVAGRWTGTMNLTEPQSGSDLSGIRTHAVPHADGSWRISGQKIFISWGEHDLSENIVHLVLTRTPDAPAGVKGISMFLVPKFIARPDGSLGERNNLRCLSIESKVGQHGGPTTTMLYGGDDPEAEGAVGWLVGGLHRGLETMFIMMNEARFAVGLEGLAVSERAYQTARAYALERIQGREAGSSSGERVAIIRHPDVRRMLMRMRACTEAMRALAVGVAVQLDNVHADGGPDTQEARALLDLLTPVMKGWNTETAQRITSLGVQIHGGLGFMEECQAAQHWKDARILPIYEGTTGIQASDLVGRKIAQDGGATARALLAQVGATARELGAAGNADLAAIGSVLADGVAAATRCVEFVVAHHATEPRLVLAGSVPLLELFGRLTGGWQLGRGALAAHRRLVSGPDSFMIAKVITARFFAEHEMSAISGLARQMLAGGGSVLALAEEQF